MMQQRIHLFELEDLPWLPAAIRDGITDFLEFAVRVPDLYRPVAPRLERALEESGASTILDLCAGGGGPWMRMLDQLGPVRAGEVRVLVSDLYPNRTALARLREQAGARVEVVERSVSAMAVPRDLEGFRTLFSAFHHFRPREARAILADAVEQGRGIAVFESTQRHPLLLLYMLFTPLLVLLATPFIRPFRWSRLFWTYLIPAIPLAVMFDGIVSCLRTYSVAELDALTRGLEREGYRWERGVARLGPLPVGVTYLIGLPGR
ncbi:class I SAM-dependent methyltransferase [Marichromatium sp. AB32]|uniref:class I SAM-dependent methyltransferase n=1 Tax=Marichromatium sp. AB32 TaxID=2483363 RepID=UPI000F3BA470|nr:class I SAM-dependent methyltransferase [Marichromatium sp. AB32]MBO8084788.1 class I SAM-dependent methyltransferase [Marichromatium sp.]RNE93482.1 class I SAM-dependent methyltransferase [Marichromatium sp. AB32]